jgi:D-sedoheptulose 7-phosphate isomerase
MLGATLDLPSYLQRLNKEVSRLNQADIEHWADLVYDAWNRGRQVFIFGNGGSATTLRKTSAKARCGRKT